MPPLHTKRLTAEGEEVRLRRENLFPVGGMAEEFDLLNPDDVTAAREAPWQHVTHR
jgi:hypothetical protein